MTKTTPPKDKGAQRMGRKGWKGLKEAKGDGGIRTHMSSLARKRWDNARAAADKKPSKPSTTSENV